LRYVKVPGSSSPQPFNGSHRGPPPWPGHGPACFRPPAPAGPCFPPFGIGKDRPEQLLRAIFKAFEFCIPTKSDAVPTGPDWLHEIKYDGYRLRLERDGDRVRLITRGGYNLSDRYPWIVEAALKNRHRQYVIDGDAVVLGVHGTADFDALRRAIENVGKS